MISFFDSSLENILIACLCVPFVLVNFMLSKMLASKILTENHTSKLSKAIEIVWQNAIVFAIAGALLGAFRITPMCMAAIAIITGTIAAFFASPKYIARQAEIEKNLESRRKLESKSAKYKF